MKESNYEQGWAPPSGTVYDPGLRARTLGDGTPVVLLLHGCAGSNRYFGAAFDDLGVTARLVAPGLLGFGGSPKPEPDDSE